VPLKLSPAPFCDGLPGSMNAVPIPCSMIHFITAHEMNSGRLSQRRNADRCASFAGPPTEYLEDPARAHVAVDVDRQALLRELVGDRPAFELSSIGAGIEHEVDGPDLVGAVKRVGPPRTAGDALARPSAWKLQACAMQQTIGAPQALRVAIAAKEDPDPAVAVMQILSRQRRHALEHLRVLDAEPRALAQRRAQHLHQRASLPIRHASARRIRQLLPAGWHARHFCGDLLHHLDLEVALGPSFFRRAFSCSSWFCRQTSSGWNVPNRCFHVYTVWSLTLCRLATAG
jgi:hypothetical protein